jgi:hypothetical protein
MSRRLIRFILLLLVPLLAITYIALVAMREPNALRGIQYGVSLLFLVLGALRIDGVLRTTEGLHQRGSAGRVLQASCWILAGIVLLLGNLQTQAELVLLVGVLFGASVVGGAIDAKATRASSS